METSNLSHAEFETLTTWMLKKRRASTAETIPSEMKDTPIEIKNTLQRINSRVDKAEYHINCLECKEAKNTQYKQQKKKKNPKRWG